LIGLVKESTSSSDFLIRTAVVSVVTGVIAGIAIAARWEWRAASGFMVALLWGLGNFGALAVILRAVTDPRGPRVGKAMAWIAIKLVGLYGVAILALAYRWFPLGAFVVGLSWPLAVGALRALTPAVLGEGATTKHAG
jgi:hypothetical protein